MTRVLHVLATLAMLASASPPLRAQQMLKPVELGVGGQSLLSYLPLTLALQLGYFRDEGLDVKINDFAGGSKSIEALVAGSVDVVGGAYENALFLQARGIDLKAVVLLTDRFGLVFALNKQLAAKYRSPKDIRGLRIGVTAPGSAVSNALEIILAKDGLKGDDVSMIGIGGGPGAIAAMKSGQIDGLVLSDPAIMHLEVDGVITPIVDSREQSGQTYLYGGPNANSSVLVRATFAKEHPEILQSFVNATVRTLKWMGGATLEEIMANVPPGFYAGRRDIYERALMRNRDGYTRDGHLTPELAAVTLEAVANSGRLNGADKIDIAPTLDDTFWQRATKGVKRAL
jgi:NitT/TauT family transport system substrate-binding protein